MTRILLGGPDREIMAGGKRFRFEMHPTCGPAVLNTRGNPADKQPGTRSPFWTAVSRWSQQGERAGADGLCVWEPAMEPVLEHVYRSQYKVIGWQMPAGQGWPLTGVSEVRPCA